MTSRDTPESLHVGNLTHADLPRNICRKDHYALVTLTRPGASAFQGAIMTPSRPDGFLTTREAARLAGVEPVTIRQWRKRGWLAAQGYDERGYPTHTPEAVRDTEREVRDRGLEVSGIDPRRVRKSAMSLRAAA